MEQIGGCWGAISNPDLADRRPARSRADAPSARLEAQKLGGYDVVLLATPASAPTPTKETWMAEPPSSRTAANRQGEKVDGKAAAFYADS